ncbi:MAG: TIGR02594 family protein [Curvibacter sp.]|nr:TIGR02594 family protein [Curvibacter sp.]
MFPDSEFPPWIAIARAELGVRPFAPGAVNQRIVNYHAGTNVDGYDDKINWCSTFVHWCLGQAGVQGTRSALARSWLEWGESLSAPRPGCIAVLWRESRDNWKGHVGFLVRQTDRQVILLGGNQEGTVQELAYPLECVLDWRWPVSRSHD